MPWGRKARKEPGANGAAASVASSVDGAKVPRANGAAASVASSVDGLPRANGAAASGAALSIYRYNTDEGTRRSFELWSRMGPIVAHYRWIELKHKAADKLAESGLLAQIPQSDYDAEWDLLHLLLWHFQPSSVAIA